MQCMQAGNSRWMTAYARATHVDWPGRLASLLASINGSCAASWIAMLLAAYDCRFCRYPGCQGLPFICLCMTYHTEELCDDLCICWLLTPCLVSYFGRAPVAW